MTRSRHHRIGGGPVGVNRIRLIGTGGATLEVDDAINTVEEGSVDSPPATSHGAMDGDAGRRVDNGDNGGQTVGGDSMVGVCNNGHGGDNDCIFSVGGGNGTGAVVCSDTVRHNGGGHSCGDSVVCSVHDCQDSNGGGDDSVMFNGVTTNGTGSVVCSDTVRHNGCVSSGGDSVSDCVIHNYNVGDYSSYSGDVYSSVSGYEHCPNTVWNAENSVYYYNRNSVGDTNNFVYERISNGEGGNISQKAQNNHANSYLADIIKEEEESVVSYNTETINELNNRTYVANHSKIRNYIASVGICTNQFNRHLYPCEDDSEQQKGRMISNSESESSILSRYSRSLKVSSTSSSNSSYETDKTYY